MIPNTTDSMQYASKYCFAISGFEMYGSKLVCILCETYRNLNKHTKTIILLIKKNLPFGFFSVDIYFD